YGPDGNMLSRTENGLTSTYTYPPAGSPRPHAPTAVNGDSYGWDANGDLSTRTVGGQSDTLIFDAEHRLGITTRSIGINTFLYDVDGNRLLKTTPTDRTLYIEGHEITANNAGTSVTAVRSYEFGGRVVATRAAGGVDFLFPDQQGSIQMTMASGSTTV